MGPNGRALSLLLIQVILLAAAIYVAVSDAAFPGASIAGRATVVVLAIAVNFLAGEVVRLRTHFGALLKALEAGTAATAPRDDQAAIDVLVSALSSANADVRAKAHKNLVRITGQDLPPDPAAWSAWWGTARANFARKGAAS